MIRRKTKLEYELLKPQVYNLFEKGLNTKQIAKELNIFRKTVGTWLRKAGYEYSKCNKASINSDIFNKINNEDKAYWLGFFYADGYVSKTSNFELSLGLKDLSHLNKCKKFLDFKGNIYIDNKVGRCRLQFQDSKIVKNLKLLGCINNKSLILKFPTEEQVPKEFLHHFIRGYFDGDGCINDPSKNSISITIIGTFNFIKEIHAILDISIRTIKHRDHKHSKEVFTNLLTGQIARNFCDYIYKDATIYLTRKRNRYVTHLNNFKLWNYGEINVEVYDTFDNKLYKFSNVKKSQEFVGCCHATIKRCYKKNKLIKKRYKIMKYGQ